MKAAEERAHSTENTVVGQAEEELAALKESGAGSMSRPSRQ